MPLTLSEARARSTDIDDVGYAVELDLTGLESFRSTVTVRFRSRSGSTFLDLAGAAEVGVVVDGAIADDELYDGGRVRLEPLSPGEVHEVVVTARMPYVTDGEGMHTFTDPVDGERYVGAYLGVDLTQRVFACFDQPDVKATIALTVVGEPGWSVRANGRALSVDDDRWTFATTLAIPVNQFVVCAGRWSSVTWEHDGREFGWHARASLAAALERDIDELREITMACFARYALFFTTPYAFGSYHQIFVPGQNWGAQETPGCVMYRDELLSDALDPVTHQLRAAVIAHEMAHMWFGNLATMRWYEDIWLNESFADYLGYRVAEEAAGYPHATVFFETARKPLAYVADLRRSTHPVAATATDVPDSSAAASNFDAISYFKGNVLIRQLAAWLGDQAFFAGVNAYLDRYAFSNAGLDDFIDCLAAAAPDRDVAGWAQDWLRTTGFDTIEVVDTDAGPALRRRGRRTHRTSVAAFDESLALLEVRSVEVGPDVVALTGWRGHVILPNPGGETFARVSLRPRDQEILSGRVGDVADPKQRAQVWANAFLRLHEGDLDPTSFLEMVAGQLPREREPSIVQAVISWALGSALQVCRSEAQVLAGFDAVATACLAGLRESASGSVSATAALVDGAVRTLADPAVLRGWHDLGQLDHIPLSSEQRWVVVWRLAELGAVMSDEISPLVSDHDSTQVQDWAARAKAALPEEVSREVAWSVVQDERASNRRVAAVLDGLWSAGRGSVVGHSVATYLTETPRLAAHRGPGMADLLGLHHPGLALTAPALAMLADALDGELEPRLRRQWQDWFDDLTLSRDSPCR